MRVSYGITLILAAMLAGCGGGSSGGGGAVAATTQPPAPTELSWDQGEWNEVEWQ